MVFEAMLTGQAAHLRFWPRGVPRALRVPNVTLLHFLDTAAQRFPDKAAICFVGSTLRYAQLRHRVDALAAWMQRCWDLKRGDRVLLWSQNCPQFVTACYAVLRAGAVVVPINPMSTIEEVRYLMDDSGAHHAVVAGELLPALQPCLDADQGPVPLRSVLVHAYSEACDPQSAEFSDERATPAVVREPLPPLPVDTAAQGSIRCLGLEAAITQALEASWMPQDVEASPDDLCVLPYTSGTTGKPKACMHSHRTLLAAHWGSHLWRGLHADAVFLAVAPLFHMLGLQNGMGLPMLLGATVVMMPRWHAATALRMIEQHRVTVWTAPPAMVIDAFAQPEAATRDLSSLALLSGGGAAMPEAVAAMLAQRFGLVYNEAYGLSETAAFLLANPVSRGKRQCLGVPTPGVDARIVDPQSLVEMPDGEVGEIVVSGPQVMQGYWRNPQADAQAFFERDGRRFLRTGDLGWRDDEGYFFMRDRLKRMVNVSGYKVWPAEVEAVLYRHPAIHEACVIALEDERQGERVKAVVVLKPGMQATAEDIVGWSRTRMATYKAPREVEFTDALPRSGTGKIDWRGLQQSQRTRVAHAKQFQHSQKENTQ